MKTLTKTVEFPLAKLLKEKGFEEKVKSYNQEGKLVNVSMTIRRLNLDKIYYPAPTIAEVLDWLFEEYGIWISLRPFVKQDETVVWLYDIFKRSYSVAQLLPSEGFYLQANAYESAIEYILKNKIK